MFGNSNSPPKEDDNNAIAVGSPSQTTKDAMPDGVAPTQENAGGEKRNNSSESSLEAKATDDGSPSGEKKRRSSSRASSLFASAKNTLHLSGSSQSSSGDSLQMAAQTPMQKLGKKDPALAVPQGSQNNSAGNSKPTSRSSFRVGVTEDKNKKCRRTMEDTHSYLYNFLSTPAPDVGSEADSTGRKSGEESKLRESDTSLASANTIVESDNGYFAIFDGHAGTFAADWCGKKLHIILEDAIRSNPNTPVPELLDQTFTNVDQQLEKLPLKNSGCTAVIAVLRWEDRIPNPQSATGSTAIAPATAAAIKAATETPSSSQKDTSGKDTSTKLAPQSNNPAIPAARAKLQEAAARQRVLYTANVGDARIILCRSGKALRLSYDHKGSDENEGKRISNAGGLILNNRVNGVLAVTRALGDAYMKDLVTGHPYTTETVIQPDIDEFIILACDGLWDVCSDQEAVDLVRNVHEPQAASKILVDHALSRFSTDNLSCMIVRLDNKAVQDTVERKAEPIGVQGDPTTQKGGITESESIVLEAKQRVGDTDEGSISPERILESAEEEAEPGPELTPEGSKDLPKS
ncbi:MAG: ESCRT-III subunit protein did4 [Chaenotheca gracillima]|nr:MAG: ESCRT-III subunit protein did4 [Chaenotheca gracillima]